MRFWHEDIRQFCRQSGKKIGEETKILICEKLQAGYSYLLLLVDYVIVTNPMSF